MDNVKTQYSNRLNLNLEILRIISAFGIVLLHGTDGALVKDIGFSCLIVFMLISAYLLTPHKSYPIFIAQKATRLLVPWLFWFFVYGLLHIINGTPFLYVAGNIFSAVLNGTRMHLWYLPFLFITSVIIVFYYNMGERHSILTKYNLVIFALLSVITLIMSPLWRPWSVDLGAPWQAWFLMFPAVFIGITLANLNHRSSDCWKMLLYVIIIILISVLLILSGLSVVGIRYLFGFLLFVAAIYLKCDITHHSKLIMTLSNCTYGIYLIHPLIYSLETKLGLSDGPFLPYLTYTLSLLITILVKKLPGPFIKRII
jgi:hypothetical protein